MSDRPASLDRLPLEGVRVLDLTRVLSGPFATSLLADLGADVIKVERPVDTDHARDAQPQVDGVSIHFANVNRNKRSIAIDLTHDRGREVFLSLVEQVDVVVDNFRPGVMERLGLDYPILQARNDRVIVCSVSGFGQTGSDRTRPAYDVIVQAMSGVMAVTGAPGGEPMRLGIPLGDLSGGVYGALGVLAALHDRATTGRGQYVDVSMLDAMTNLMAYYPTDYLNVGEVAQPVGGRHNRLAPYGSVRVKDGHIVIAIYDNRFWRRLTEALQRPDLLADERFATRTLRLENRETLYNLLEEHLATGTKQEWVDLLREAQVPVAPVRTIEEVAQSVNAAERDMFVDLEYPDNVHVVVPGRPIKFPNRADMPRVRAPDLGEHGEAVLHELLGLNPGQIDQLRQDGAIL